MSEYEEPAGGLRVRAARGTVLSAGVSVGLQALSFLKAFVIAGFLTAGEYGLWGILVVTIGTLTWLKQIGISEKYVQQEEEDQEVAFQRAFTLDLISNGMLMVLMLVLLPVFAVAYGQWDLIAPGLLVILTLPAYSLRSPAWIFYRQMRYGRQLALDAADPVVSFVVAVGLAVAGFGYWSLVIGVVAGVWAAALLAVWASPYKLRLTADRESAREYFSFSWPLVVANASGLVIPQVSMVAGNAATGLAGAGAIALAGSVSTYTDKVDQVVTWTLYPALCRAKDRIDVLFEAFVKSNRLTLMWGIPFGVAVALFAPDVVHYGLGSQWDHAIGVLQAFGLIAAMNHIGFNWSAFFRARGDTRPLAIVGPVVALTFLVVPLPLMFVFGLDGFAAGVAVMAFVSLLMRAYYLRKLFRGFRMLPHALRAISPTIPAVAAVLLARVLEVDRDGATALGEVVGYVAITIAATLVLERSLLREVLGYALGAPRAPAQNAPARV